MMKHIVMKHITTMKNKTIAKHKATRSMGKGVMKHK